MGPPGIGKTLLAKAVAGEANGLSFRSRARNSFRCSSASAAGRVRDMFKTAKEAAPCILFIDEIDAVGRVRGAGLGGGHDEREQTLNQILSEMDGFSPNEAVIVLAATNRPGCARSGAFAARAIRSARHGRPAELQGPRRDLQGSFPRRAAGGRRRSRTHGRRHRRPDRSRHPQPGQRSRAVGHAPGQGQSHDGRFRGPPATRS